MLSFLHSYFTKISFEPIVNPTKPNKPSYICRDNLEKLKKRAKGEAKPLIQRDQDGKKLQRHISHPSVSAPTWPHAVAGSKPMTNHHGGHEEKEWIRVKVLMTKEEALRLISKCKEGGVFEFKDVAREVSRIPSSRVTVVSSSAGNDDKLESIPEEP